MGTRALEAPTAIDERPLDLHPPARQPRSADLDLQAAVAVFVTQKPRLVKIAHRILADRGDAEDVVQEVWLRWQRTDRDMVNSPPAFLATATSRIAINVVQSARSRHEAAVTPRIPEILVIAEDPESTAERTAGVELALHVLLERLNPAERAAYVLRNGFDYPYREIASVLQLSIANARQLVRRAHARIHSARRQPVSVDAHRRLVRAFVTAARAGEFTELETLLVADIARTTARKPSRRQPGTRAPAPLVPTPRYHLQGVQPQPCVQTVPNRHP